MKRIAITNGNGKWFDADSAEAITETSTHDGRNHISDATGSQTEHETLYRTKGGKWILNHYSDWQGTTETYEEINNEDAARWMAKQGMEPHEIVAKEFNDLEIQ